MIDPQTTDVARHPAQRADESGVMRTFTSPSAGLRFERARAADGRDIHALVRRCGTLDVNSPYAYVLLCDEFGEHCVVARSDDGRLVGFVTGFVSPRDPETLVLWQVGVDPDHRGRGLAHSLVRAFIDAGRRARVRVLETTIAPTNTASLALFGRVARDLGSTLTRVGGYPGAWLGSDHPDENRYAIALGRSSR